MTLNQRVSSPKARPQASPSSTAGCPIPRVFVLRGGWVRRESLLALAVFALSSTYGHAQVSLATAVDLALSHSPKIRLAQTDVDKARASLGEARNVFIPVVNAGANLGESYGYSFNPPTLFTFNAQSLVFNFSQKDYIRAGHFGVNAAALALQDARQGVIEDTALSFLALQHDQQREAVLKQENEMAQRLVAIVEDRVNAGRDTAIDLTTAQLTAAQFHLSSLRQQDDTANDRDHLALTMGMSPTPSLTAEGTIPDALAHRSRDSCRRFRLCQRRGERRADPW
jgi:outer membrane protein TolC